MNLLLVLHIRNIARNKRYSLSQVNFNLTLVTQYALRALKYVLQPFSMPSKVKLLQCQFKSFYILPNIAHSGLSLPPIRSQTISGFLLRIICVLLAIFRITSVTQQAWENNRTINKISCHILRKLFKVVKFAASSEDLIAQIRR